jgi:hypothetical protein
MCDHNRQAKRQPRDEMGRWIEANKHVFIDESGDMGFDAESTPYFVVAATVTGRVDDFRAVADHHEKNTNPYVEPTPDELKYWSSSPDVRRAVLKEIAVLEPTIYAKVVHKGDRPEQGRAGRALFRETIEAVMDDVMRETAGTIAVIYDEHTSLDNGFDWDVAEKKARQYGRELVSAKQKISREEKGLQTHDFVAVSTRERYCNDKPSPFDEIAPFSIVKEETKPKKVTRE